MFPPQQKKQPPQAAANPEEDEMYDDTEDGTEEAVEDGMEEESGTGETGGNVPVIDGEQLQALLFDRVKQLTPEEMQILDSIVTPESVPVLFKLFPELGILFDMGSQLQGSPGQEQAGGGQPAPPAPEPQRQEESQNPLSNPDVSRGLRGY